MTYAIWISDNPLPEKFKPYMDTWGPYTLLTKADLPNTPYVQTALKNKRYIFLSGYLRYWILYHQGGLYLDCDVEVLKPLPTGTYLGFDDTEYVNVNDAVMSCEKGNWLMKAHLEALDSLVGDEPQSDAHLYGPGLTTKLLVDQGLQLTGQQQVIGGITIYPSEYFYPLKYTNHGQPTERSYTIHHWAHTWL